MTVRKYTINTIAFIFSDIINKAIPFLLLPILTTYLGVSDYGILSLFNSLSGLIQVVIGYSFVGYLNLNYFSLSNDDKNKTITTGILIFFLLFIFTIVIGISTFSLVVIEFNAYWVIILSLIAFLYNINSLRLAIWILEENPIKYSIFQILETLIKISISLYLIIELGYNWQGRVYGILIGTLSLCSYAIFQLYRKGNLIFIFDNNIFNNIFKYGKELIVHQLSQWVRLNSDKILIGMILGTTATGIFSVSYQFGLVLGILTTAINKSWVPYFFKSISNKTSEKKLNKLILLYIPSVLSIAFILNIIFEYIILNFFSNEFHEAIQYIPFFLLAFSFQGMYFMLVNYIFYYNKNNRLSTFSLITSLFHLITMYYGISYFGLIGASYAFLFSYFLLLMLTGIYVYKISNNKLLKV